MVSAGWRKRHIDNAVIKDHCNRMLEALVGRAWVEKWWNSPNVAFDGKTPTDTDLHVVHSYLLSHSYGGEFM